MTELRPQLRETGTPGTLKLITFGRISGLPHIVALRFAQIGDSFFVLAGKSSSDWVRNVRVRSARLRVGDFVYQVAVEEALASEKTLVLSHFKSRYGVRIVRDWYARAELCLKITPMGLPSLKGAIRGENEARLGYQEWSSRKADYYHEVANAFDSASEEYDFTISRNFINTWIRQRSIHELLKIAKPTDTLIEIGCGTGTEAIQIARHVSRIIATDISEQMLGILKRKVEARRLSSKVLPLRLRASEISDAGRYIDGKKVQLVYSFNGALNCEPDIEKFVAELSSILERGGYFICSIRNTLCLMEELAHALVFQFRKMAPRKEQPIMVSVGGMDIPSIYYAPARFVKYFVRDFGLKKQIALPGLMPPAYLNDYYLKLRRLVYPLERVELLLSEYFPINRLGDQTLLIFQKK